MSKTVYKVAQHPKSKLWFVMGSCGGGYYMPISDGYKTKAEAIKHCTIQPMIDADARRVAFQTINNKEAR